MNISRQLLLIGLISLFMFAHSFAQETGKLAVVCRLPYQNAKSVCVDTHLNITFNRPACARKIRNDSHLRRGR